MQNLYCRNVRNVKFPKIVAEKFAFYTFRKKIILLSQQALLSLQHLWRFMVLQPRELIEMENHYLLC